VRGQEPGICLTKTGANRVANRKSGGGDHGRVANWAQGGLLDGRPFQIKKANRKKRKDDPEPGTLVPKKEKSDLKECFPATKNR